MDAERDLGEQGLISKSEYIFLTVGNAEAREAAELIAGFEMVPHAQAWADACHNATSAYSFGTYNGHDPSPDRAIDAFSSVPKDRNDPDNARDWVLGDDIAKFSLKSMRNGNPYGIDYIIWRQHIYNPEIADYWRYMETRAGGNITQNHFDHVHHSFNETAPVPVPKPKPIPKPIKLGDAMSLSVRYVWGPDALNQTDWVFDGPSRVFAQIGSNGILKACDLNKIPEMGKIDTADHEWFKGAAAAWERRG